MIGALLPLKDGTLKRDSRDNETRREVSEIPRRLRGAPQLSLVIVVNSQECEDPYYFCFKFPP